MLDQTGERSSQNCVLPISPSQNKSLLQDWFGGKSRAGRIPSASGLLQRICLGHYLSSTVHKTEAGAGRMEPHTPLEPHKGKHKLIRLEETSARLRRCWRQPLPSPADNFRLLENAVCITNRNQNKDAHKAWNSAESIHSWACTSDYQTKWFLYTEDQDEVCFARIPGKLLIIAVKQTLPHCKHFLTLRKLKIYML